MQSPQVRKKFLDFFKRKGHKIMPSSSLLPKDSTVLFTSAGMQQFIPYLTGKEDPLLDFGTHHLASCQKCFRADDIDKVGDETHHTFFEMLGNWSIGEDPKTGYFKEGAIKYALEFFINELGLKKDKIWVTIFRGEDKIPRDEESFQLWRENGILKERIKEFGMKENFWGPVGGKGGPCGPSSEIYFDRGEKFGCKRKECGPNCPNCNRFFELWNLVFMEYQKNEDGTFEKLPQRNIDTGIGFERLVAVLQEKTSGYETDLFLPIYEKIKASSNLPFESLNPKVLRILSDHIRASTFLISEGVLPSNVERGYILRMLIRRCIRYAKLLRLKENWYTGAVKRMVEIYNRVYPEIRANEEKTITVIKNEEEKFRKTLEKGLKRIEVIVKMKAPLKLKTSVLRPKIITGKEAFDLYQSYGFPIEMTKEIAREHGLEVDEERFRGELKRHQEISRKGAVKKFGGGGEFSPKLHTATHLLHSALRKVLGKEVRQIGSDITTERLRFDFSFPRKLTETEIKKIEGLVNQKINENLNVQVEEMPLEEALRSGALAFFKEKYPPKVKVYTILNPKTGEIFSKEICAGPHVKRTRELGQFRIQKEESLGMGEKRIRAILI